MDEESKRSLRSFMIKMIKRYMMEIDFLKNAVVQNAEAFESNKDLMEQFDRVKKELQAVLDYNFYLEEVKEVESKELE